MPMSVATKEFGSASGSALLPKPIPAFAGAICKEILIGEGRALNFEVPANVVRMKVAFPSGVRIIPTYGVGAGLGVDKPLMEPRIRKEEKEE